MPVSTALSHKPTVTHLTQEGTAVVKSSDGSAVDPRLHFASTYSISYGRFALSPPKAYRPYAASVALTTVANPILAPTADVKQPTAFTTNEKPFIPYHASIDRFATSSEKPSEKYTSESKFQYQSRTTQKSPEDYRDAKLMGSSFTRAYFPTERFQHGTLLTYMTSQRDAYRDTKEYFERAYHRNGLSAPEHQKLVDAHPKTGTAFTHNAPTKHQFGDNKFNGPVPPKVSTKQAVSFQEAKIVDDGFTREYRGNPTVRDHIAPKSPSHPLSPVEVVVQKQLINPQNPLNYRKITLPAKRGSIENHPVTSKIGERSPHYKTDSVPKSPASAFAFMDISPTSPKHISGNLANTGDEEFLRVRGRHVQKEHYVTEVKGNYRWSKPKPQDNLHQAQLSQSAFTKGNKLSTSPWRHLLVGDQKNNRK